jgi:membrane protease YdiL (CAAX protease family)
MNATSVDPRTQSPDLQSNNLAFYELAGVFSALYLLATGLHRFLEAVGIAHIQGERKEFYSFLKASGSWGRFSYDLATFFSSLYEEVLYRVYLLHRLRKYFKSGFGPVILSSLAFASTHGYHLAAAFVIFYQGVLFAVFYQFIPQLPMLWIAHWLLDLI